MVDVVYAIHPSHNARISRHTWGQYSQYGFMINMLHVFIHILCHCYLGNFHPMHVSVDNDLLVKSSNPNGSQLLKLKVIP